MKKVFFMWAFTFTMVLSFYGEQKDSLKFVHLQEVQVVSSRAGATTPMAFSNMDRQDIEAVNFGRDIPFLIAQTPSVIVTSDAGTGIGYTGFRVRGTDANRINITANGIPLNDSESHGVFWVNMPDFASSLQDLQIQRGVGTSTNGAGAFGASVNMKTENIPQKPYGEWNGGYGSFNTAKSTFRLGTGIVGDHWAFDARLSSITSDGFIDRASVDLKSYFAQGAYFNDRTVVKFVTFSGKEKTYHAWDGVSKDELEKGNRSYNPSGYMYDDANGNPLYYKNQTDNYQQTHYQLILLQELNPDMNLNIALHYTPGLGYYEEYKPERTLSEYRLTPFLDGDGQLIEKSDLVRQKHLDNDFGGMVFSLDYAKDRWNVSLGGGGNRYDGNHFGYVTWVRNYVAGNDFAPEYEYYRSKGEKTDANIYLKANFLLTPTFNLYGDLQYRHIDYSIKGKNDVWDWNINAMQDLNVKEAFDFFNPKAGLLCRLNRENRIYGSFAVAHREPNRNNYTDANAGQFPKSERLLDYEAGYHFEDRTFKAGINLYYMQYKDQLVLTGKVNEIGEALTSNVPDSYRMGVEFTFVAKIASCLQWSGNLTLSDNKIKRFAEYVDLSVYDNVTDDWEYGDQVVNELGTTPIAFSPAVTAGSLFAFSLHGWNVGLQSSYVGKQYIDNTGSDERSLDAYFVNNLRLGYTFHMKGVKSLQIGISINNLFNEEYENNAWVYSYYQQPDNTQPHRYRQENFGYFPQAGTNIMTNLCVRF
jgi:iron complex outermembrane receptor protein